MIHIKSIILQKYLFWRENYCLFQFTVKIDCLIETHNYDMFSLAFITKPLKVTGDS